MELFKDCCGNFCTKKEVEAAVLEEVRQAYVSGFISNAANTEQLVAEATQVAEVALAKIRGD